MGARTIRLDEQAERVLGEVMEKTGMSVSEAVRKGLVALRDALASGEAASPYEVFRTLDLGPGGEALAPARDAKRAVRRALMERARR